jgi:phage N-6-adenine-methyltransferase
VKNLRDKAIAVQAYCKQAKDRTLIEDATEIRMRAERRAGELLAEMGKNKGEAGPGRGKAGGKTKPAFNAPPKLSDLGIGKTQSSRWQRLAALDEETFEARVVTARKRALSGLDNVRGTTGTGENEWFTPVEHIKLVRKVLGAIDLDPATHEKAQTIVRAAQFFTKEDDGLKHQWHGRTWLNPPYAQPFIAQFVSKLCREHKAGRVTAAIMLTHNYTDTAWFREAASAADAICFTHGRVKFYEPDGTIAAPTQGQAFFYFGDDVATFDQCFASIGFVLIPYVPVPGQRRAPR